LPLEIKYFLFLMFYC